MSQLGQYSQPAPRLEVQNIPVFFRAVKRFLTPFYIAFSLSSRCAKNPLRVIYIRHDVV
jgi:hypothetical protein